MNHRTPRWASLFVTLGLAAPLSAADHAEAPTAASDPAADIADFYAWHTDSSLVFISTFAPLAPAGAGPNYDADVLYGFHVDTDGDGESDHDIWVRFGQNGAGAWGVQALGLLADGTPLEGGVGETVTDGAGASLYAGSHDDPFFFDITGLQETLATGTIAIDSTRDSLAGTNVTAIVAEVPIERVNGGSDSLRVWTTTGRE